MPRALRSVVPDLLFDDERDARVLELGGLVDEPDALSEATPLHRVTVFLTYRCNLDCPYCKTIARNDAELEARPQKRASFDEAAFERLLLQHRGTPLRHLHFTGGEASLVPGFADLVRRAKQAGVERLSVTTNRQRSARFVKAGRCLEDPICQRYCLHCTRAYNEAANAARSGG